MQPFLLAQAMRTAGVFLNGFPDDVALRPAETLRGAPQLLDGRFVQGKRDLYHT